MSDQPTRRKIVLGGAVAASGLMLPDELLAQKQLVPTPSCDAGMAATQRQTEGPFFKPKSPERQSLLDTGMKGPHLELIGLVLARNCKPVPGALLDFWQADAGGAYDNSGFRLRGHQFANREGAYRLRTIMPAQYTGRTAHIHVKVQAPNQPVLTTQLYFPDQPQNARDPLFRPELLMRLSKGGDALQGRFDFVLDVT
jgi:protocatechuate 3,4-dioxygenase beta subunit